jgi:hypothetical protein
MTDHNDNNLDDLEQEIASLHPRAVPAEILDRLSAEMGARPRTPWADRCLLGAIGAGLAASVVIVSMLVVQSATTTAPAPAATGGSPMAAGGAKAQRAGDYLATFARADGHWGGIVK